MKTALRTLIALLAACTLLTACGDDKDDTATTIPTTVATTTARPASSTTAPATVAQNVTDGAVCNTPGARGTTQGGIPLVCTQVAGSNETRWRPA